MRPADYPPPFRSTDAIAEPTDPPDERIDVGLLVVGAGPAGLACAIRFGQLLEENPATAEQLGELPLAIVEKGKQPGFHLLSGAILNPRSLTRLFPRRPVLDEIPSYGPVRKEAVYLLSQGIALRVPTPPPMRNRGGQIVSLSQLGRWMAQQAEQGGAVILPETTADTLLVSDGRVSGVRTSDRGRGVDGTASPTFQPGTDIVANITVLAEGTHGHLTEVALDHFDLHPTEPQVWELGVKEVWRLPAPPDQVIHTMGWPLRPQAKYREFGGSFIYPMGPDMLTIGMVVGLDYRDVSLSVHDLLQQLKTHPFVRDLLRGGERVEWGAKTIPGGGFYSLPRRLHAPGLLLCGDGAGMVNVPTLKGIHYAIESGRLAAEAAFRALSAESRDPDPLARYDELVRASFIWTDLRETRAVRQAFGRGFLVGTALAGAMTLTKGRIEVPRPRSLPDASQPLLRTDRADHYPAADGSLTFDKLSSVFASGNQTRDDAPNHIRIQTGVPADLAEMWVRMCPAHVYTQGTPDADGLVTVSMAPANCVQCGAISSKGGRLTPPEGGSGPEYTIT
jgi:electron-transferring-flavoprotein dehydrogenase